MTTFKYIVVTLKDSSEEQRTVVALTQWYDSHKQKCRYPAPSQMSSCNIMEILKTSCSPHQSWPNFKTVEVHSWTGTSCVMYPCLHYCFVNLLFTTLFPMLGVVTIANSHYFA
jgi:hypothetical protein